MEYSQAFFIYIAVIKFADALTLVGVWYLVWLVRFNSALLPVSKGLPMFEKYSHASIPLALVFSAVFHIVGAYRRDRIHFGFRAVKKITQGCVLGTLVFISICYFLYEVQYSRLYLALFPVIALLALLLERGILQLAWNWFERAKVRRMRLLLMGEGDCSNMYLAKLDERKPYPIEWVGRLGDEAPSGGELKTMPYLGPETNLEAILASENIDQVILSHSTHRANEYQGILERLSNELVGVKVIPDFGKYSTFTYSAEHECGIPLLVFNQTPVGATDRAFKRLLDIIGSLILLILFAPVALLISILIKLTSKGPILYSQQRMGADGRIFTFYKFRTMPIDAEAKTGAVWATPSDDRATPIGKWLRRRASTKSHSSTMSSRGI